MDVALPSWFKADQIFTHDGHWYFGSPDSLHIGPYDERAKAEARSRDAVEKLLSLRSNSEQLRFVRKLLHDEWDQILLSTPSSLENIECIDLEPAPEPLRHGEAPQQWYRSNRFFKVEDMWFFSTREGVDVGPYRTENEARKNERRLVRSLTAARNAEEAFQIAQEFKHRPKQVERFQVVGLAQFRRKH